MKVLEGEVDEKTAVSLFVGLATPKELFSKQADRVAAVDLWATMLNKNHPTERGSYLHVWAKNLGGFSDDILPRFRDALHARGNPWVSVSDSDSIAGFVFDLWINDELFKLTNFKGAAKGMINAAIGMIESANPVEMFRLLRQAYRDCRHLTGTDFLTLFDKATWRSVKNQLEKDFREFSRLPEEQQSEIVAGTLFTAYLSRRLEIKGGKARSYGRRGGEAIPKATVVNRGRKRHRSSERVARTKAAESKRRSSDGRTGVARALDAEAIARSTPDIRELRAKVKGMSGPKKGTVFENWVRIHVFEKRDGARLRVTIEDNPHLGAMWRSPRSSDLYIARDGSLWDAKAHQPRKTRGRERVAEVDALQVADYDRLEQARFVLVREPAKSRGMKRGTLTKKRVTSINYVFIERKAAEANKSLVHGHGFARVWYIDDHGTLQHLD